MIVAVSHATEQSLHVTHGIPYARITTIYNGIDYTQWDAKLLQQSRIDEIRKLMWEREYTVGLFF